LPLLRTPRLLSQRRFLVRCIAGSCFLALFFSFLAARARAQTAELTAINVLIQQGKLPEAEQRLGAYLKAHPRSARASYLLGTVALQLGNPSLAEESLKRAIAFDPSLLDARLCLGDALLSLAKPDAALYAYQRAAKLAPLDPRPNLSIAKLYIVSREFQKSLDAIGQIPVTRRTPDLLPTLAAAYLGLDQPDKAGIEIQSMLQIASKHPDLVPELAEFFLAHHDFKSAQQLLTLAKEKQPATDRFLVDLAQAQAGLGELDAAQTSLESILERKPDSVNALLAAGKVAALQTNWQASGEAFARANLLSPNRPEILYGLVRAQLQTDQPEAALATALALQKLSPGDLRATYQLTLAYFGLKKYEEAKKSAQQVLAAHPEDREMNLVLTDIALNYDHDLSAARAHANSLLRLSANDPSVFYYLGMIQKLDGDVKGAIQYLTKSVSLNSSNADAQGSLGALCLQAGDLLHAVPALERAVQLAPEISPNHYQLALAYSRAGAPDKAKVELEKYQQMKAKEAKDAKDYKGPSTSEIPSMGIGAKP
jgi:tetratricopeptide (TPR) repeat protein